MGQPEAVAMITLDPKSLAVEELSMAALTREISLRERPAFALRAMMNALERRRVSQRLGWSRPWNKRALVVFRSHVLNPSTDHVQILSLIHI